MADRLKVSQEAFNSAIQNFEARKAALQVAYMKVFIEVHQLDSVWKGEANATFTEKFGELYKNVEKTEQVMDNIIGKLKSALSTFESEESNVASMISSAEEGTAYPGHL